MRIGLLCIMLTIVSMQMSLGQNSFHRTYPAENEDIYVLDAIQLRGGRYASLHWNIYPNQGVSSFLSNIVISVYDPKGVIAEKKGWSKKIDSLTYINPMGSLVQGANDSIYFQVQSEQYITTGVISADGNFGKIVMNNVLSKLPLANNNELLNYNKSLFSAKVVRDGNTESMLLSRKNYNLNSIWNTRLSFVDSKLKNKVVGVSSMSMSQDTSIVITGRVDSSYSFVTIIDTLGSVIWSKKYNDTLSNPSIPLISDAMRFSDSTYILTGSILANNSKGLIVKTDKIGEILWSKKVQFAQNDSTVLSKIAMDNSSNFTISGVNFDTEKKSSYPFAIKLNRNGNVIWKKKFEKVSGGLPAINFSTSDGGSAIFHTSEVNGKKATSFIKLDDQGRTTCEQTISEEILFDSNIVADTLVWVSANFLLNDSLITIKKNDHKYKIATPKLETEYFCPNEPIDFTFLATQDGATNYKWSTGLEGASADSLRVMKEGEYSVMVTINKDVCFVLCDTGYIERLKLPSVGLTLSLGNFCTSGKQTLSAIVNGGKPEYTYTWSTGETSKSIEIANPGTYSVTIVDQCNETANATITVGPFPTKIKAATITDQIAVNCLNGTLTGTLTAQGNSTGFKEPETYQWNNGSKTKEISINDSDILTFTVTVTDGCGTTATATKVIELKGAGVKSVKIYKTGSGDCKDRIITLNAVTDVSGSYTYVWSNGVKTANFTTDQPGTFSVTVTDKCGNSATDSSIITKEDFEPADLAYANIFFPDGADLISRSQIPAEDSVAIKQAITTARYNRTFGPIPLKVYCLDEITNYEFYVFNRWGQLVFESKSVTDEWNGEHKDEKAPTETYMWVTKYTVLGIEKVVKGSVTLLRP